MLKHFRQGTGFLVESEANVEQSVPGNWHPVAAFDIGDELDERAIAYEGVGKVVLKSLKKDDFHVLPVYVQGTPNEKHKESASQIQNPTSMLEFEKAVAAATKAGYPPHRFRVYIAGPDPDALDKVSNGAIQSVYKGVDQVVKADGTYDHAKLEGWLKAVQTALNDFANNTRVKRKILVWFDIEMKREGFSKTSNTKFEFVEKGNVVIGLSTGHAQARLNTTELNLLKRSPTDTRGKGTELREVVKKTIYNAVWVGAEHFVFKSRRGLSHTLDRVVNQAPDVRIGYDTHHDQPTPIQPTKKDYKGTEPHTNVDLHGDDRSVTNVALRPNVSKVIPSIAASGGDLGTNIVTADPDERRTQKTDGSFTRVPSLKSKVKTFIPTAAVTPIIDEDKYAIIFGIHYDSPMLSPKLNNQLYWYSSRNQFFGAAKLFGELTGDRGNIAYRILRKRGNNKGMTVSLAEFEKDKSPAGTKAYGKLRSTIQSFWRHADQGQKMYPAKIEQYLGQGKFPVLDDQPKNPTKNTPEGIDPGLWKKYLTHVRVKGERTLGLRFKIPLEYDAEGRQTTFKFDSAAKKAALTRRRSRAAAGRRDPQTDKVTEPWGVFLVEYMLGYTSSASTAGNAHFMPVNVVRSKDDIPTRETAKRLTKGDLLGKLRKHFPGHPVARAVSNWDYVKAETLRNLPYARLMKRSIMYDEKDLEAYNKKLANAGAKLRRTTYGFELDNMEFEAWIMLIAMPPSIADEKLGLIDERSYNRHVLSDPNMVSRLRRGKLGIRLNAKAFGLSPHPVSRTETFTTPYAKANQGATDPMKAKLFAGGGSTRIPTGHFSGDVLGKWTPKLKQIDAKGQAIARKIVAFEHSNDPKQQERLLKSFMSAAKAGYLDAKRTAKHFISEYIQGEVEQKGHTVGADIYRNVETYIKYAEQETAYGRYRIPQVIKRIGLSTYAAPIGSQEYRTVYTQIKAPSEEVAKLLIFYRLLRRSVNNKELKNVMGMKDIHDNWVMFPDLHARFLAQWAYSGFHVDTSDEPRNIRFIQHNKYSRFDPEIQKSRHLGVHANATFLRTD